MIEFKKIIWKNLLSYGNNNNEFNFEDGVFRISATNGSGKSSIIEALNYALFGKPYRKIKLSQLINSKNKKGLETYLYFKKQDDEYRIERGMKPELFKIYKNNELIPVSSSKKGYQEILVEDILGFNENLFNQIMVKSLTKNVSFMDLPKGEKRAIIENLLDIELFTLINKNIKKSIDATEVSLKDCKKDIETTTLLIEQEQANLEKLIQLQKKLKEESDEMIQSYTKEIDDMDEINAKYEKGLEIIKKKKPVKDSKRKEYQTLYNAKQEAQQKITEATTTINLNEKKIKFLSDTCGTCPKIKELQKADNIEECHSILEQSKIVVTDCIKQMSLIENEIKKLDEVLNKESSIITSLSSNKDRKTKLLNQIKLIKEKVVTVDESKLLEYNENKKNHTDNYKSLSSDKLHLTTLKALFSDDGIKTLIIKKYLPSINKLLNTYLTKFNANMLFSFDNEFNEVILSKNQENYSYHNFSEGEKKRIDLAVLFAFIKFAMYKNKKSNTNLIIFDEILSGLDVFGVNALFDILKDHKDYQNKCILTINHNTDIENEYFDKTYEIFKEKGFSRIK